MVISGFLPRTTCLARAKQHMAKHCIFVSGKANGNYLTACYLFVKVLYAANAVGQMFLLDVFLGYDFHILGWHVLRHGGVEGRVGWDLV